MKRPLENIFYFAITLALFLGCSSPLDHSKTIYWGDYNPNSKSPGPAQSQYREPIAFLEWEHFISEKKTIHGHWEGITFEGKKVAYIFYSDGHCEWSMKNKLTKGHYEIQEGDNFYRIKISDFDASYLDGVIFHGIFKLRGEEMLFYGITLKNDNQPENLPEFFNSNAILLKRKI